MTAVAPQIVTLRGSLLAHKVLTADGWGRGELLPDGDFAIPTTIVGKLLNVRVGDTVECIGVHIDHDRFGKQFKVHSCTPVQPKTIDGVVLWMASRLPDVGATRARALVDHFGERLWNIIETNPTALTAVQGITAERAQAIATAYKLVSHEREHMSRLRGWGLTANQIQKCILAWGDLSLVVERIRADPFELSSAVDGFGFKRADRVATAMGVKPDAPGRIRAGILFVLEQAAKNDGHCFMWGARLRDLAAALLGVDTELVKAQIFAVLEQQRVVKRGARLYSTRLDRVEQQCADAIVRLTGKG